MRRKLLRCIRSSRIPLLLSVSCLFLVLRSVSNTPQNDYTEFDERPEVAPKSIHRRSYARATMREFKDGYNTTFVELNGSGNVSSCNVSDTLPLPYESPSWMQILDTIHVYSAHFKGKYIHFIALVDVSNDAFVNGSSCECRFKTFFRSTVRVQNTRYDNNGERFRSVRLVCRAPAAWSIDAVDLVCKNRNSCGKLSYQLPKENSRKTKRLSFALCGPILWGDVSPKLLVEFIEYYTRIGIRHFIFYNNRAGKMTLKILKHYMTANKRLMTILPWELAVSSDSVNYFGQLSAVNDCAERTKGHWEYTLFADLDEFVGISGDGDLSSLLRFGIVDCLIIRSAFMQHFSIGNAVDDCVSHSVLYTDTVRREISVLPEQERSKYVCRGENILAAGIHFPHYVAEETHVQVADPFRDGVMFHFRRHEGTEKRLYVDDARVKNKMATRVSQAHSVMAAVCP
ncbi:uncharacterized protein LOC129602355 [Paramacrobiotus metropolitanus]|uniref:uncharacterized protein LOC129602355 n=1 Tax=Paramacrobiotus metropolitanus TaxID=2943436 RepID=UPI00244643C8|nr:uncharacterized protein LOC129602355 [Paramacrobiotus metropolitanus]